MTLYTRFLSWLLWLANARMSSCSNRDAAYAIKERILRRLGQLVGEDIQHIKRECYGCEGSGYYYSGEDCYRCGGTGVWDEKWIRLERWQLAGRIFHRPAGRMSRPMNGMVTVEGRIEHNRPNPAACWDALLWLALLFDRQFFWRELTSTRGHRQLWRPMLGLQALVFEIKTRSYRLRRVIMIRRQCSMCGQQWTRWFNRGSLYDCPECAQKHRLAVANGTMSDDDDLPF